MPTNDIILIRLKKNQITVSQMNLHPKLPHSKKKNISLYEKNIPVFWMIVISGKYYISEFWQCYWIFSKY
jgi:hypothetical protein